MNACDHCPAKAGSTCPAITRNHPRLCDLAAPGNPDAAQRDAYVALLRGDPRPAPAPKAAPLPVPKVDAPSLMTKLVTATAAAVNFVASGFETLPAEAVNARLAICNGCDQRTAGGLCSGCGCVLAAKARLPHETCPLGKWPTPQGLSPEPTTGPGSTAP